MPETKGAFVDLDGTWVRYDAIAYATQRKTNDEDGKPMDYCAVVLTVGGAKAMHCRGTLEELFHAVRLAMAAEQHAFGLHRGRGMRESGIR